MRKNEVSVYAAAMLWALALQGCGGGVSTAAAPAAVTLGGTAAVGAPIVGATIGLVCAGGVALTSAPTSSTGAWQLTLGSQALPCAAKLSGGTVNGNTNTVQYHSIATSAGTMNITPLTDLLVANMAGVAPATWFAGLPTNNALAAVNAASVTAALTQLRAGLALTQLTTVNPIVLPFSPVAGNLMDDLLSSLQTALSSLSGVTYAQLQTAATASNFSAPAGLTAAYATSFAASGSGGGGSGGSGGSVTPSVGFAFSRVLVNGQSTVPGAGTVASAGLSADITFGDTAGITSPRLVVKFNGTTSTLSVVVTSVGTVFENYGTDPVVVPGNSFARICLIAGPSSSFPGCAALGVSFNKTLGTVVFANTPMTAYSGTTAANFTLNGTGTFTPF